MSVILPVGANSIIAPGFPQTRLPANFAVPEGLVGYWGFDADCVLSSTLTADLSGNGNHGTLSGTTKPTFTQGQVDGALSFNGTTAFVLASDISVLASATQLSVGAWVNTVGTPTQKEIVSKYSISNQQFELWLGNGTLQFYIYPALLRGVAAAIRTSVVSINDNKWHFLFGVFNGGAGVLNIYVDGALSNGPLSGGAIPATLTSSNEPVRIGASNSGGFYPGIIDDVRIYNRALAPWEIIQLYKAGLAGRRDAGQQIPQSAEVGMM